MAIDWNKRIVFVLGAGASKPYGLPTATELANFIMADPVVEIGERFSDERKQLARDLSHKYARKFRMAGLDTIDEFVSHHPDLQDWARQIIALKLLKPQRYVTRTGSLGANWYRWLANHFLDNHKFARQIDIVTFNYDLTLELALTQMLCGRSSLSLRDAWELVDHAPIHHVYGRLKDSRALDLLQALMDELPGDESVAHEELADAGSEILVMPKNGVLSESEDLEEARLVMYEADIVVFVGFGYHETNLKQLGITHANHGWKGRERQLFGTAYGLDSRGQNRAGSLVAHPITFGEAKEEPLSFLTRVIG